MSNDDVEDVSRAVVRRWFEEVWNQRRDTVIEETMADGATCHMDEDALVGAQDFRQRQYEPMIAAFPDVKVTVDALIADGNEVAVRWTATGNHTGHGLGFAPTGKPMKMQGMSWIVVHEGKLSTGWQCSNIEKVIASLAPSAAPKS